MEPFKQNTYEVEVKIQRLNHISFESIYAIFSFYSSYLAKIQPNTHATIINTIKIIEQLTAHQFCGGGGSTQLTTVLSVSNTDVHFYNVIFSPPNVSNDTIAMVY